MAILDTRSPHGAVQSDALVMAQLGALIGQFRTDTIEALIEVSASRNDVDMMRLAQAELARRAKLDE